MNQTRNKSILQILKQTTITVDRNECSVLSSTSFFSVIWQTKMPLPLYQTDFAMRMNFPHFPKTESLPLFFCPFYTILSNSLVYKHTYIFYIYWEMWFLASYIVDAAQNGTFRNVTQPKSENTKQSNPGRVLMRVFSRISYVMCAKKDIYVYVWVCFTLMRFPS